MKLQANTPLPWKEQKINIWKSFEASLQSRALFLRTQEYFHAK